MYWDSSALMPLLILDQRLSLAAELESLQVID